jgi:hypothetical protein
MTPEDTEKGRTDPIYFVEHMLGMKLHAGQKKYLEQAKRGIRELSDDELIRKFVLTCANRWGKTAVIACLQLWYLFYKFGIKTSSQADWFDIEYRTANIAPFSSLTEPVFMAMKAIMTSTYPIRDRNTGIMTTNKCKIEAFYLEERTINNPPYKLYFGNNSYIEHLSLQGGKGDNLQGKPYGLITYDEATRSDHLQIELDNSVLGRLLDWTGALHLIGTPDADGKSLMYMYGIYQKGLIGVESTLTQEGSIYENHFMTEAQIEEQEKLVEGNPLRDQMLHGKFVLSTLAIFPGQDVVAAQDSSLNDGKRYEEGHKYVIGVDTAIGEDEMVYHVVDVTQKPYQKVWTEAVKGKQRSPQMHLNVLINLIENYRNGNNLQMIVETFNGESARFYQDLPPYIKAFTHTYGSWQPSKISTDFKNLPPKRSALVKKADILVALKKILADHNLKIPENDQELINQLVMYRENDKGLATDRLIALALAVWLAEDNSRVETPAFVPIEW